MNSYIVCRNLFSYIPGLALLGIGAYVYMLMPHIHFASETIRRSTALVDGNPGYAAWMRPKVYFKIYLFHVTNPDEIMDGAEPILQERGPYVYDVDIEKRILEVDDDSDEIVFSVIKHYKFNKKLSGKNKAEDSIIVLNSPYVGIVNTLTVKAVMFLGKLGNQIQNLFPKTRDIFLRTKVKNLLFEGLPLVCDKVKFPDLAMVCTFLEKQKPPLLKEDASPGSYTYSLFGPFNGTEQGPFAVNRGIKDKDALGNLTSYKNSRLVKYWNTKECNTVAGTDSLTWASMSEKWPYVSTFEPSLCRTMKTVYKRDEILHGIVGYRYEMDESIWADPNISCYCPLDSKKQLNCLPTGLLDISKCQDADAISSEPHFLHGDPDLLDYAKGLTPDPQAHSTYVVIDPLTGAPLQGSKKMQLNARIKSIPAVKMLHNVTEGIFPFLWCEETSHATVEQLGPVFNSHRFVHIMEYFTYVPMVLGAYYILSVFMMQTTPKSKVKVIQVKIIKNQPPNHKKHSKQPVNRRSNAFK